MSDKKNILYLALMLLRPIKCVNRPYFREAIVANSREVSSVSGTEDAGLRMRIAYLQR
jgi:hypothetical protein